LTVNTKAQHVLDFVPTTASQKANYKLYFMCDSYLGADQEFDLPLRIHEAPSSSGGDREKRKRKHEDSKDEK
jgi:pre-mRNA-splicing helicase BRR2